MPTNDDFDSDPKTQAVLKAIMFAETDPAAAFAEARTLEKGVRVYLANKIEEQLVPLNNLDQDDTETAVQKALDKIAAMEEARKQGVSQFPDAAEFQSFAQFTAFVLETNGDNASPFVYLYTEELSKLTAAEYALPENHGRAFCKALAKIPHWADIKKQREDEKKKQQEKKARAEGTLVKAHLQNLKKHRAGKIILKRR